MAKRISELDIATSVSDSDFIPCVQGGVTKRATRAALYPDDVPVDTTSRIFDLTGDRVPPIPDDPAGVTYLRQYGEFSLTDYAPVNNTTESLVSGNYRVTFTGAGGASVGISRASYAGKLFVAEIYFSSAGTFKLAGLISGTYTEFKSYKIASPGTVWVSTYIPSTATSFYLYKTAGYTAGDYFEVRGEYIGTGANLSKPPDRAGVPWTNVGALPVDGPFGKGLQFEGNAYMQAPGPMIGTTGTIAFCISPASFVVDQYPLGNRSANGGFGTFIAVTTGAAGINFKKVNGTIYDIPIGTLTAGVPLYVAVTYDLSEIKVYKNGVLYSTTPVVDPIGISVNRFQVGKQADVPTANAFTGTIYAIRADSRVWTDEEIARWSRDPYSEDSGLIDAFSLNFANLPTFADNAAAIAGNLPVGKLYKTSTGNVLVRY